MHVFTGTTYLCIICFRTWRGKYDGGNYNHIEMCGLFWHFVDLVWILVFTFIYLIPA
jgi:cytochrome c oxidase subunit 3